MKTSLVLWSFLVLTVLSGAAHSQQLLLDSGGIAYTQVRVSPDNNEVIATAALPGPDAGFHYTALHFFDRKKKTKSYLTSSEYETACDLQSIGFSPDGSCFFGGGGCFFGAWKNPSCKNWFIRHGCPDIVDKHEVLQFAVPRTGTALSFVSAHRVENDEGQFAEFKVVLWRIGKTFFKQDVVKTRNKRLLAPNPFKISISGDGNLLACYDLGVKKITVYNLADFPFKEHEVLDGEIDFGIMNFSPNQKSLWVRMEGKLQELDLASKNKKRSVIIPESTGWYHALSDSELMIFEERAKENPVVRFVDLPGKTNKRVQLEHNVTFPSLSPDETIFAAPGQDKGIYLWNVSELRKKAK